MKKYFGGKYTLLFRVPDVVHTMWPWASHKACPTSGSSVSPYIKWNHDRVISCHSLASVTELFSTGSDQTLGTISSDVARWTEFRSARWHSGQDQLRPGDSKLSAPSAWFHAPLGLFVGTWGMKLAVPSKAGWQLHYKRVVFPLVDK